MKIFSSYSRKILWRGICGRCPQCGVGEIFKTYIRPVDKCMNCGEEIGAIRADDGPAWLTIFLVSHIAAPFIGYFASYDFSPEWLGMFILVVITLGSATVLLPRSKGLFIAGIWLSSKKRKKS